MIPIKYYPLPTVVSNSSGKMKTPVSNDNTSSTSLTVRGFECSLLKAAMEKLSLCFLSAHTALHNCVMYKFDCEHKLLLNFKQQRYSVILEEEESVELF